MQISVLGRRILRLVLLAKNGLSGFKMTIISTRQLLLLGCEGGVKKECDKGQKIGKRKWQIGERAEVEVDLPGDRLQARGLLHFRTSHTLLLHNQRERERAGKRESDVCESAAECVRA